MTDNFDISMIDMTQTVPNDAVGMLSAGGLTILTVFLALLFVMFVRYKAKVVPLLLGVIGYIIFIFMGSNLVIGMLPEFASADGSVSGIEVCVTAIIMTLFYTVARIIIANIMKGRFEGPGDVLVAGLAFGVGDAAVFGVTTIMTLMVLANSINQVGMQEMLANMGLSSEAALNLYVTSIYPIIASPSIVWLLAGISISMDMLMNVGLMMINCGVAGKKLNANWYIISALINFAMLLPFTFNIMHYTKLVDVIIAFTIKLVMFAVFAYMVVVIDDKYLGSLLKMDLKGYTYERMPHFGNLRRK